MEFLKEPLPRPVVLHLKGIVPSFKTQKTAYGWIDKKSGKVFARPATLPEHKEWMSRTVQLFASQLRFAFQIAESTTLTDPRLRSLIASLPRDDRWTVIPELIIKGRPCAEGEQAGVEIVIERLT